MTTQAEHKSKNHFIKVAVSTTSGLVPGDGFNQVPINQPVNVLLIKAAHALGLTETDGWVVRIDDVEIDPKDSYQENGLSGTVTIDWGPSEGGGGA